MIATKPLMPSALRALDTAAIHLEPYLVYSFLPFRDSFLLTILPDFDLSVTRKNVENKLATKSSFRPSFDR